MPSSYKIIQIVDHMLKTCSPEQVTNLLIIRSWIRTAGKEMEEKINVIRDDDISVVQ